MTKASDQVPQISIHDLPIDLEGDTDSSPKLPPHDLVADLNDTPGNNAKILKSSLENKTPTRSRAVPVKPSDSLLSKRIIAYPVHAAEGASGSAHWTLGVLVNRSWERNEDAQVGHDWVLLHFDTLHCNDKSESNAMKVARFISQKGSDIELIDVPVPRQPPLSNNCGLYPAHLLKIFLSNVERSIKDCTAVSISEAAGPSALIRRF